MLVRPEERDALLQVVDGDRRGARGRAAAAAVRVRVAVPAVRNYARANRGVVLQPQGGLQRLGDGVRAEGGTVDLSLGHKCGQAEVVVPEVKRVITGRARVQEAVIQEIHPVKRGERPQRRRAGGGGGPEQGMCAVLSPAPV